MQYIKQNETRFDAHGHWNTVHTVEITAKDAYALLFALAKAYPKGDPDFTIQVVREILEKITAAKP